MKLIKKVITFITLIAVLASCFGFMPVHAIKKDSVATPDVVGKDGAYAIISDTVTSNGMTVKFGGSTGAAQATADFPEKVTLDGVKSRKLYRGTDMYITLDKTKFKGDKFLVIITYYDFGPDEGPFRLRYNNSSGSQVEHVIRKTGMEEKWVTVSYLVDDLALTGKVGNEADLYINNGLYNAFSKIEVLDYSDSDITVEGKVIPKSYTDNVSKRTSYYMNFNGKPAIRPYVTAQGWNYQGTKFIFSSFDYEKDGTTIVEGSYKLYEYDIVNCTVRFLDSNIYPSSGGMSAIVTPDNMIYYAKADGKTWKMNGLTYEKEPTKARTFGTMNVTNDGEWVTGYGGNADGVIRSNTITGEIDSFYIRNAKGLWESNPNSSGKGHPMINYEYPNLLFFCHEGSTEYIPDRLWLANYNTDTAYNMFVQVPYNDTITAETSGHEAWAIDGESMYWVKYTYENNIGQSGLMRTDKFGNNREYINGDYKYWHCNPSLGNNFVVGDTNDSPTKIVIANTNTYEATVISSFNNESATHPNQPHPHISFNNYSANWQMKKGGVTCIGWNVVRDITAHTESKQIIPFGTGTSIITCNGAVSDVDDAVKSGVNYKKVSVNKGMYIDILNDVCASSKADVTIELTYRDTGTNNITITYTSGVDDIYGLATREDKTHTIARTGSGKDVTKVFTLKNINANNAGKFASDFYISSSSELLVKDIKITAVNPGGELYTDMSLFSRAASDGTEQFSGMKVFYNEDGSKLYHIDDTQAWQNAGISQQTVDAAIADGINYVGLRYDSGWMFNEYTDKAGIKRMAFYSPKNYRQQGSPQVVEGNIYFYVADNTIGENDNKVTFNITYLDKSDFYVHYTSTADGGISSFKITGENSGYWRNATVTVNDAKMSVANTATKLASGREDIKIASKGNDMYISSVSVSKENNETASGVVTSGVYYNGYESIAKISDRVSVDASNNVINGGIVTTETANSKDYNSKLYHVDDTNGWQAEGILQETVDMAIKNNCEYVTSNVDGAWMYKDFTDSEGVTKTAFYSPANFRKSANLSFSVNSNIYLRLTDDTITKDDNNLIFAIEYLDTGKSFGIDYVSKTGISSVTVSSKDTGKWEIAYVSVSDAALSSTNTDTKLATWREDIKIRTSEIPVAGVTVMKKYDGVGQDDYEIIGGTKQTITKEPGDISSAVAVVNNDTASDTTAMAFEVIYNNDGSIKSVESSPVEKILPHKSADLVMPETLLLVGESQKIFVWNKNLKPLEPKSDPLNIMISKLEDGNVRLWWDNTAFPGYFLNIYSDGKMVGRTIGNYIVLDNLKSGDNNFYIDVADNYGRVIIRSKPINVTLK